MDHPLGLLAISAQDLDVLARGDVRCPGGYVDTLSLLISTGGRTGTRTDHHRSLRRLRCLPHEGRERSVCLSKTNPADQYLTQG